jgi:hypothetical protein
MGNQSSKSIVYLKISFEVVIAALLPEMPFMKGRRHGSCQGGFVNLGKSPANKTRCS